MTAYQRTGAKLHAWVNVKISAGKSNGMVGRIGSLSFVVLLLPFSLSTFLYVRLFRAQDALFYTPFLNLVLAS